MCWNADISINTFLFTCLALLFIFITNTYTKYKSRTFDNPLVYVFLLNVAGVQLAEFFLWRNLKNKSLNETFSRVIANLIAIQPATLMLMIPNVSLRYSILAAYAAYLTFYIQYKRMYSPIDFSTTLSKSGHLSWEWIKYRGYENIFFLFMIAFYLASLLLIDNFVILMFGVMSIIVSFYFYYKSEIFGSMWCWVANLFMLYFIVDILMIKPYYEYNGLC